MTLNEPPCFIGGHQDGGLAPGLKLGFAEVLRAAHHTLLAHGRAVQTLRACAKKKPLVGLAPCGPNHYPASDKPADIEAARQLMFTTTAKNVWQNAWWLDPVFFGRYPEDGLKMFAAELPPIREGDLQTIRQPLDFFGVNIYQGSAVRAGADGKPESVPHPVGLGLTAFKWFLTPEALYWGPRFFWERYRCPIVITENGMSGTDWVSLDGKVHDPQRIDYLTRYLRALRRAADDGVPVLGYFTWSILDNFEWCQGFKERFGIVHVDYPTQKRTLKDSAHWYREVIATNGASLG
jgi:beta-glucosidase